MEEENCFSIEKKDFCEFSVGDVIENKVELDHISDCSFAKQVSVRNSAPFCMCSIGPVACLSNGKRLKFKHLYDGFHVTWICSKLIVPPNSER